MCKLTETEIQLMAEALSWARTYIDDRDAAMSKQETLLLIDLALQPWNALQDPED